MNFARKVQRAQAWTTSKYIDRYGMPMREESDHRVAVAGLRQHRYAFMTREERRLERNRRKAKE